MQAYQENISAKVNGVLTPILGVKVTVTDDSTGNPATLFSDNGVTQISGDIVTDETGYFGFRAANGSYTVKFSSPQIRLAPRNIDLYDPLDDAPLTQSQAAAPTGASGVGYGQRTVENKLRDVVSVKDFGAKGDGIADDTAAIQASCNYAASNGRKTVLIPAGTYKVTQTIWTCDVTAAVGATGCGLLGEGEFATRIIPSGDFTVFKFVSSYVESGSFSIEWPLTAAASIPTTRVGVEFADANYQVSYATIKSITVMYAYRGYVLKDWTGQTYGTMFLTTLSKLTAFRCADWGFYLSSKTGSTTLRMLQCYVRGDSSAGGAYGKGIYVTNFTDLRLDQPAIDQCLDSWISLINYNDATLDNIALESNKMGSSGATAILLQGSHTAVRGLKTISCTYDTSGNARVVYCGASCILSISGYNEQANTIAVGTTRYKVAFNASGTDVSILDRSILPADILDNGWYHSVVYQGVRRSRTGTAPSYGTWIVGDYVKNGAPSVGQPKGWYCTNASGSGTWTSEGNL